MMNKLLQEQEKLQILQADLEKLRDYEKKIENQMLVVQGRISMITELINEQQSNEQQIENELKQEEKENDNKIKKEK
jgi:hypothetical protein